MNKDQVPEFIGAEKHVTFGGRTSGGVNIPGGLRSAVPTTRADGHAGRRQVAIPARTAPRPIGWDKHITFGGSTSSGVNIPGGLRMPVRRPDR